MSRRTKEQIAHADYCSNVDSYKYFIMRTDINVIVSGWEFKEDAKQEQIDNDSKSYTKIYSKTALIKCGFDIYSLLKQWKK